MTAYTPLSAWSINQVPWEFKFLSDCKNSPPLWDHAWCSCNQPESCQILVGTVSVLSCLIYFLSTHILKQWLSLPSCHFGKWSQRRNQSSLGCCTRTHLRSQYWMLFPSSRQEAMWRNWRPALLKNPCLLTKMICLNSCTIRLPNSKLPTMQIFSLYDQIGRASCRERV